MTKNAKIDNGEETASSIMMLGKLENYMQKKKKKNKLDYFLTPRTKINSK